MQKNATFELILARHRFIILSLSFDIHSHSLLDLVNNTKYFERTNKCEWKFLDFRTPVPRLLKSNFIMHEIRKIIGKIF